MSSNYLEKLEELERAILTSKASLTPAVRKQILERARSRAPRGDSSLPAWIEALTDAVVKNPATAEVDKHLEQGQTEEEIFEVVTVAAVGVALARADQVLPALRNKP